MKSPGLQDKTVIVTGGAQGLGQATALRFAAEGCRVCVWDLTAGPVEGPLASLAGGKKGAYRQVDVTDAAGVLAGVAEVIERWGRIDVLVNNAGILRDAQLVKWKDGTVAASMSDDAFDQVLDVNLRGVFLCTRAVVPHMIEAGGGVVLNASSIVARTGNFGQTNYAATKAAVVAMTRTWARELGQHGIRVNAVAPGFIATDMVRAMPDKVLSTLVAHTPLGRMGQPEDVAEAYVWLASERAAFVHGAVLAVDGGLLPGT